MSHFQKQIETDHGFTTFYFNRVIVDQGTRFHVSAVVNKKAVIFHMEQVHGQWKIMDPVSIDWLSNIENQLSDAIAGYFLSGSKNEN